MTEAPSAEPFRLLQQEIVLARPSRRSSATSGPPLMRSALKWKC